MTAPRLFERRVLIGMIAFGVSSFVFGLMVAIFQPASDEVTSAGADTFSRSALGHRALVEVLETLDVPVVVARNTPWRRTNHSSVLIIAEPPVEAVDTRLAHRLTNTLALAEGATLVVLPRFGGELALDNPGWVKRTRAAGPSDDLLALLDLDGTLATLPANTDWYAPAEVAHPTPVMAVQVLRASERLEPVVSMGDAVLLGRMDDLWVLTDPMLINTAGLAEPDNAAFAVSMLGLMSPGGTVVFDETVHGHATPSGVWARLFEFPLVLATGQAALVVGLLLWAGMRRFGAPEPTRAALGRGQRVFIESVARMGWLAGHGGPTLRRYWLATRGVVAQRLHAPSHLSEGELSRWLDRRGKARQAPERISHLISAVNAAATKPPAERLAVAQRIHAWRRAMLGDP